jgi:hypothetical protein
VVRTSRSIISKRSARTEARSQRGTFTSSLGADWAAKRGAAAGTGAGIGSTAADAAPRRRPVVTKNSPPSPAIATPMPSSASISIGVPGGTMLLAAPSGKPLIAG